jgi:hypothetical protein
MPEGSSRSDRNRNGVSPEFTSAKNNRYLESDSKP